LPSRRRVQTRASWKLALPVSLFRHPLGDCPDPARRGETFVECEAAGVGKYWLRQPDLLA
ncbi:MAG TPA: hypothetical protein VMW65_17190, partial [Chloroflexota bacterium]|nr:hypothetical protein [Chloroflexota bacterium]